MKKKRLVGICMAAILLLSGCGTGTNEPDTKENTKRETEQTTTVASLVLGDNDQQGTTAKENESHEGMIKSKLTGEWIDPEKGNRRPIAVMLNNIKEAIPQSSIEAADIVYEAPVEGGITRLMGIYEDFAIDFTAFDQSYWEWPIKG